MASQSQPILGQSAQTEAETSAALAALQGDQFTKGYVAAMFGDACMARYVRSYGQAGALIHGVSDLAPETQVAVARDCERAKKIANAFLPFYRKTKGGGRAFWLDRQAGKWGAALPPLSAYLSDDGLVRLRAFSVLSDGASCASTPGNSGGDQ